MRAQPTNPYVLLDRDYGPDIPGVSNLGGYDPSLMDRVVTWPSRLLDQVALNLMEKAFLFGESLDWSATLPGGIERVHKLYADAHLLESPQEFFGEPASPHRFDFCKLQDLPGGERVRLCFESTYQTFDAPFCDEFGCHSANTAVTVHLWRHDDMACPTVMCLHCWCGGYLRLEERIFAARRLYAEGLNVAVVTLPFHGERTPSEALFSGQYFPSPDLRRTNEAFGQAVADVRLLTRWVRDEGHHGPLGLMGISLGGYVSSLMVSLYDDYDFVIPIISPASFADILWWHGHERRARSEFEQLGIDREFLREVWAVHSPLSHQLSIPKDRVLIVAGAGDEVVRPAQSLALWKHWGEPDLRWFAGSHLGHFRWLAGSLVRGDTLLDFMHPVVEWMKDRVIN